MNRALQSLLISSMLGVAACGGSSSNLDPNEVVTAPLPAGWPTRLLVSPGEGPALFTGSESTATTIAYISEGVQVELTGGPIDGRIPVRVEGGIKLRGYMPVSRLAARVTRRARVAGTPVSVGPGQWLGIRGLDDGKFRVVASLRFNGEVVQELGPYEGTFPTAGVSTTAGASDAEETRGERGSLPAGQVIQLRDEPNGRTVATLPARAQAWPVFVARRQGRMAAVRVGDGPYLSGWTDVPIGPPIPPRVEPPCPEGPTPARLASDNAHPLRRVHSGARIRIGGRAFGVLTRDGYARVWNDNGPNEVDVFVAVDNDVAVRGLVRRRDLF